MINSKDFKTKTIFEKREYPGADGFYGIALDIGYSAVKGFGPHGHFCFPAYVRKLSDERTSLKQPSPSDIIYRDNENGTWAVGEMAYEEMASSEIMDSEKELYGRLRYYTPSFKIIARAGLAMALNSDVTGCAERKAIAVQTGLPPEYLRGDSPYIKDVLAGSHDFYMRIGNGEWKNYRFYVADSNIFVMPQPMGTLISVSVDREGRQIKEAEKYLNSNVIIFDPGFGTLDDYPIANGRVIGLGETFPELGMHEVLARTCEDIEKAYGIKLQVPQLQERLAEGTVMITDIVNMKRRAADFTGFLEKNCRQVCSDAIEKMKAIHGYFQKTDYIIGTGGTYDAWKEQFGTVFRDMEKLTIVSGNINDPSLSNIFSNVRGYYFYLMNKLKQKTAAQ